jgi:hypothetical protein
MRPRGWAVRNSAGEHPHVEVERVELRKVTALAEAAENDDHAPEEDGGRAVARREHTAADASPGTVRNVEDPRVVEEIAEAIAAIGDEDLIADGVVDGAMVRTWAWNRTAGWKARPDRTIGKMMTIDCGVRTWMTFTGRKFAVTSFT